MGETNRSEPFSVGLANSGFGICPVDCYSTSKLSAWEIQLTSKMSSVDERKNVVPSLLGTRIGVVTYKCAFAARDMWD